MPIYHVVVVVVLPGEGRLYSGADEEVVLGAIQEDWPSPSRRTQQPQTLVPGRQSRPGAGGLQCHFRQFSMDTISQLHQ